MERIMVGTDGSDNARAAVRWAAALAKAEGAQLLVAHSYAKGEGGDDGSARKADSDAQVAAWAAEDGLGDEVTTVATEGDARHTLGPVAADWKADLLVVGSRGGGGFSSLGLGSVTHHLAHHVDCALAVVPPAADLRPGAPLLVGVDGSKGSRAALEWAVAAAPALGAPITAALAYDPQADSYPHPDLDNWKYRNQREAEEVVRDVATEAAPVELRVVPGNAVAMLEDLARAHEVAAVVVGTRSRGAFHRTFLGRVPMQLLRSSSTPVVIARA